MESTAYLFSHQVDNASAHGVSFFFPLSPCSCSYAFASASASASLRSLFVSTAQFWTHARLDTLVFFLAPRGHSMIKTEGREEKKEEMEGWGREKRSRRAREEDRTRERGRGGRIEYNMYGGPRNCTYSVLYQDSANLDVCSSSSSSFSSSSSL